MANEIKYTGHGVNTGGLQGHSIGEEYPRMVVGAEHGWKALNLNTGVYGPVRETYAKAKADLTLDALKHEVAARIKKDMAYAFGYNFYAAGNKAGNPFNPVTSSSDYGKFGAGWFDARRIAIGNEAAELNYENVGMVLQ